MEKLHFACYLDLCPEFEFKIGDIQYSDVALGDMIVSAIYRPMHRKKEFYSSEMYVMSFNRREEYEKFLRRICMGPKKIGEQTTIYIAEEDKLSCWSEKDRPVGEEAQFFISAPDKRVVLGSKCKITKSEKQEGGLYSVVLEPGNLGMKRRFLVAAHCNPMVWTVDENDFGYERVVLKIGDANYACYLKTTEQI